MRAFILDNGMNTFPYNNKEKWNPESLKEEWKQKLQTNGNRLSTALQSIAPKGTISKLRWK